VATAVVVATAVANQPALAIHEFHNSSLRR